MATIGVNIKQLITADGQSIIDWQTFQQRHPQAGDVQRKALWLLTHLLCNKRFDFTEKVWEYERTGYRLPDSGKVLLRWDFSHSGAQAPAHTQNRHAAPPRGHLPSVITKRLADLIQVDSIMRHGTGAHNADVTYDVSWRQTCMITYRDFVYLQKIDLQPTEVHYTMPERCAEEEHQDVQHPVNLTVQW